MEVRREGMEMELGKEMGIGGRGNEGRKGKGWGLEGEGIWS